MIPNPNLAEDLLREGVQMRTGHKLGRTLYVTGQVEGKDYDLCIGIVDSPVIAELICAAVNGHRAEWGER